MRWLLLLLIVLNIFYCVWHLQGTPPKGKEIISLSLYKGSQQDIRLLSESDTAQSLILNNNVSENEGGCLYLTGILTSEVLLTVKQELGLMGLRSTEVTGELVGLAGNVLLIASDSRGKVAEMALQSLANKFNGVKYATMRCQGLQPSESLHRIAPAPQ